MAQAGIEQSRAAGLAISMRENELLGHPIELKIEDERCSPEGGGNAALRIAANSQAIAVLGTTCSNAAAAALDILSDQGLALISSANTSPFLTEIDDKVGPDWQPGYFRTTWNDNKLSKVAATFTREKLDATRVVLINSGDIYTLGLTSEFQKWFSAQGGETILNLTVNEDDLDPTQVLNAIQLSNPQVVFMPLRQAEAASRIIKQSHNYSNLSGIKFIVGESMFSDEFIQQIQNENDNNIYILGLRMPTSPSAEQWREKYRETFKEFPHSFYYLFSIDATNLLLDAIKNVAIVKDDGTLYIGREALRNELYHTVDYPGITGQIECNSFGDCGNPHLQVFQFDHSVTRLDDLQSHTVYEYQEP
jgi:branched-chain amino acid transport system substrate-binding protein